MARRTLLLVEDDPDDVAYARSTFAPVLGSFEWRLARDGAEALDMLLNAKIPLPGLLILDLRMPRMTGFELLQRLRVEWGLGLKGVRVVVLSTSGYEVDREQAKALGVHLYLRKPRSLEETAQAVRSLSSLLGP